LNVIKIHTNRQYHEKKLVDQELFILPEHPSLPPVISGVRVAGSLVFCVVFYGIVVCPFVLFVHCAVYPSSN